MALKRSFFDRVNEVGLSELLNRAVRAAEAAKEGEDWVDRLARAARAFVEALPPALPPNHEELEREALPFGLHLERAETYSVVRWRLEPQKIERAQRLLGGRGVLTLSILTLTSDDEANVSRFTESIPVETVGERTFLANEPNEARVVSIGLDHDGRFVSIEHVTVD
ncbi:MAG: hypothetical protein GXY23_17520 [Myxococcales bacterium]|nr:hypothetical protein [Myxococcales bacterium]